MRKTGRFGARRGAISLATILFLVPLTAVAAELEVIVEGLQPTTGVVHVALFSEAAAAGYPYEDAVMATRTHPAGTDMVTVDFIDLEPGTYALAVLHDSDGNGKMTMNFLGLPLEGYGFSNGATGFLGPPSFKSARVTIAPNTVRLTTVVSIHYP